jgi:cyclopropane fatty-acyl-phospholipid synthase-like methyltransferase
MAMRLAVLRVAIVVVPSLALAGCASEPRAAPAPPAASASPSAAAEPQHHDHRSGMPHRFEHADEWAKDFDDPARDAWQRPDDVVAALGLRPGMTVADVGAGTGYFTVRLARAIPDGQVIATDIEPDMVRYLGERAQRERLANIRTVLAGAADPNLAAASVDRILVVDVWHHLGDRRRYAAGLAGALRPGGEIAVVDFTAAATHGPPPEHRLTPAAIMADLEAAGLTASVSPVQLPEQYIVVGVRR